jgi:hypothetical protein
MTAKEFKKGDKVSWNSTQGMIKGTVKKKLTAPMDIKTHHEAASPANPEILVQSARIGQLAAHKPAALKRIKAVAAK